MLEGRDVVGGKCVRGIRSGWRGKVALVSSMKTKDKNERPRIKD